MFFMNKIHELIHRLHNPDAAKLFIRIALGVVFVNAGWFKIQHMDMVLGGFASMGFPALLAYVVAYGECISGILFLAGIFVRYAGIFVSIIMLVATFKVHFPNGFSMANGGYEYTFVLFFMALAMVTLGAGSYSLANVLKR